MPFTTDQRASTDAVSVSTTPTVRDWHASLKADRARAGSSSGLDQHAVFAHMKPRTAGANDIVLASSDAIDDRYKATFELTYGGSEKHATTVETARGPLAATVEFCGAVEIRSTDGGLANELWDGEGSMSCPNITWNHLLDSAIRVERSEQLDTPIILGQEYSLPLIMEIMRPVLTLNAQSVGSFTVTHGGISACSGVRQRVQGVSLLGNGEVDVKVKFHERA